MCHVYPTHSPSHVPLHTTVEQHYINTQRHIWLCKDNPYTRVKLQPPTSRSVNIALGRKRVKAHYKLGSGASIRSFWSLCQGKCHNLLTINTWKTKFVSFWQSCFVSLGVEGPQPWGFMTQPQTGRGRERQQRLRRSLSVSGESREYRKILLFSGLLFKGS